MGRPRWGKRGRVTSPQVVPSYPSQPSRSGQRSSHGVRDAPGINQCCCALWLWLALCKFVLCSPFSHRTCLRSCYARLGSSWACFGLILGHLRFILSSCGVISCFSWTLHGLACSYFGRRHSLTRSHLGCFYAYFNLSEVILGLSRTPLQSSWTRLAAVCCHPDHSNIMHNISNKKRKKLFLTRYCLKDNLVIDVGRWIPLRQLEILWLWTWTSN